MCSTPFIRKQEHSCKQLEVKTNRTSFYGEIVMVITIRISVPVKSHAFSVRVTLQGIKSHSHAHSHYSHANTKSTNWKISVMIKLPKQNWFAEYGNSDPLEICFNVFLSHLLTLHIRTNLVL